MAIDKNVDKSSRGNQTPGDKPLGELVKGIRVAMLTTVEPDGILRSRPMATREAEFDGHLWFFTSDRSGKANAIRNDQNVNLAYVDLEDNRYISVCGRATLVHDDRKMSDLWDPSLKAWFPDGLDDPDMALLRVDVESAEYWDAPSSAWVQLIGFTKAMLSGRRYEAAEHHGRVDIRH